MAKYCMSILMYGVSFCSCGVFALCNSDMDGIINECVICMCIN